MADAAALAALASPSSILRVALPAILTSVAPPACVAVQLALLARVGSTSAATFAGCVSAANLISASCNFLVNGVASQVGAACGARRWGLAAARIRVAVVAALLVGTVGGGALLAAGAPLRAWLRLDAAAAPAYWRLRAALVPVSLLTSAATGSLNGYGHVTAAAWLASGSAAVETAASVALLSRASRLGVDPLVALGLASIAVAVATAGAGLATVAVEARRRAGADGNDALLGDATDAPPDPPMRTLILQFVSGGSAILVRSLTLQLTFFAAVSVAARRGTSALVAHAAAAQLWMATSYTVDGLESAAIVLGSRVAAAADRGAAKAAFAALSHRLLAAGVAIGVVASALLTLFPVALARLFVGGDADALNLLTHRTLTVLAAAQPLCAVTFITDGIVYALPSPKRFVWARNVMVASFACLFVPTLTLAATRTTGVWAIWVAKVAHNAGRASGNWGVVRAAWR